MAIEQAAKFGAEQVQEYREKGYYFPAKVLAHDEIFAFRDKFLNHLTETREQREKLSARDQYLVFSESHTYLNWVHRIVSHPKVLDAVEAILGPDLMVWSSRWFAKKIGRASCREREKIPVV